MFEYLTELDGSGARRPLRQAFFVELSAGVVPFLYQIYDGPSACVFVVRQLARVPRYVHGLLPFAFGETHVRRNVWKT